MAQLTPTDKALRDTQAETQCLALSQPMVAVEADHGTAMLLVLAAQVVVAVLVQAAVDQTITLVQTTAVIQIWEAAPYLEWDFRAVQASDLTVKVKTVTKPEAVVVQVVLDSVQKMTVTKAAWA